MKLLKNKGVLFVLFLTTGFVTSIVYVSAEEPHYRDADLINLSELSETDIDQMAAVLAEMQSARENIK